MKKAKFFLTTTAVAALVGGACAFAHKSQADVVFCDDNVCALSPYSTVGNGILVSLPPGSYAKNAFTGLTCESVSDCVGVIITRAYFNP